MARIIKTFTFPQFDAAAVASIRVITPHRAAAATVGTAYISLPRIAQTILRENGLTTADQYLARELMRQAATEIAGSGSANLVIARLKPILATMQRRGIEPDDLIASGIANAVELGRFAAAYREKLRGFGMVDPAESVAVASAFETTREPIAVWGHFRPRVEEVALIDRITGDGSVFWLPLGDDPIFTENRRHAERLVASGWTIDNTGEIDETHAGMSFARTFLLDSTIEPLGSYFVCNNRRDEIRSILTMIKASVASGKPISDMAIVCPHIPDYADIVSSVAAEYGLPVRLPHRLPLVETAVGSFALALLDMCRSDFRFDETLHFVKHPFGPGLTSNGWRLARETRPDDREAWENVAAAEGRALFAGIEFDEKQALAFWISMVKNAMTTFEVRQRSAFSSRESIALKEIHKVCAAACRYGTMQDLSADQARAVIAELLSDADVPYQPGIGGVTIFDPDTVIGALFDTIYVVGMAEGHFPATPADDPVIDFYTRGRLAERGIDFGSAADIARSSALSFFATLMAASRSVVFTMPMSVDTGRTVASPYLERLGLAAETDIETGISSEDEHLMYILRETEVSGGELLSRSRHSHEVETKRELSWERDEWDGVIGEFVDPLATRWSASQLTKLGQCSFRWFSEYVLRLKDPDEIELGIDPSTQGSFYHRVLELAVDRAMTADDLRLATLEHLEAAFVEVEQDPGYPVANSVNWEMQRLEHLNKLRNAVRSADFILDGARVLGVEQEFLTDWNGIKVRGTIDRVDLTNDGLAAIDYKSGTGKPNGAKSSSGKPDFDIQIPLYATVGLAELYPDKPLGSSYYFSIAGGEVIKRRSKTREQLKIRIDQLMQQLREGYFPVDPDVKYEVCRHCEFEAVCRKGPRLSRKHDRAIEEVAE